MNRKTLRQFGFLLLIQVACVAVGSWLHLRYNTQAIEQGLEQQACLQLDRWVDCLSGRLDPQAVVEPVHLPSPNGGALSVIKESCPPDTALLLTDGSGRLLAMHSDGADLRPLRAGDDLSGLLVSDGRRPSQMRLSLAGDTYLAVRKELSGVPLYLWACRPSAPLAARAAALTQPMIGVSAVMGIWIIAVLTIAYWVLIARYGARAGRQHAPNLSVMMRQARHILRTRDAVIFGLAKLADSRDSDTGEHLDRISAYATILASALRHEPRYAKEVTATFVREIGISAALHDIGKVGIEDSILLKAGPLTREERVRMQSHTEIGDRCLREIEQRLGSSNFLQMARQITRAHHERWDGAGYPQGLMGEDIPLAARIVAIADVYDALASKRVYKLALPHEECSELLQCDAGKAFDPNLIDIWLKVEHRFREISGQHEAAPSADHASAPDEPEESAEGSSSASRDKAESVLSGLTVF